MRTILASKNGSTPSVAAESWLRQTAREFFSGINWDDHPPAFQELKLVANADGNGTSLSLLLTVQQFFSAINWEGTAVTPNPTPPMPNPEPSFNGSNNLTLEDFSDLF